MESDPSTDRFPVRFKASRSVQAIKQFREIAGKYLNRMTARMKEANSIDAMGDYEALIVSLISVSWDQRSIERLLTVLGRVKGHDQQKISIQDQATYQELLDEIRQSVPRQLLEGEVKVKETASIADADLDQEEVA